jgi:hypothetical protein
VVAGQVRGRQDPEATCFGAWRLGLELPFTSSFYSIWSSLSGGILGRYSTVQG